MTPVAIPPWNSGGVIPPVNPINPVTPDRSPYAVSLAALVLRFGTSADRRRILDGFLRYRSRLHVAGLVDGFQWLDGSFLEHVEMLEGRSPNDLDVVTFFRLPPGTAEATVVGRAPDAFPITGAARAVLKSTFFVDPYFVYLDLPREALVTNSTYWYSLWSHRRDGSWKGYLQVDLGPSEDTTAAGHLGTPPAAGSTP
jgi:hypothetical protein